MTKIPGVPIIHAVITPNCRTVERPQYHEDPRMAAFEEAVARAREKYRQHVERTDPDFLDTQNIRLVLLAQSPRHQDTPKEEGDG